jgi:transcriptional regulator GlxA family with amidase domain
MPRTVGIFIFENVEVLDCCGPFEVFSVARHPDCDDDHRDQLFQALMIAEHPQPVTCVGGLKIEPNATFTDHPPLDLLVVPGGFGRRAQMHNTTAIEWIARQAATVEIVASVCTGAFLLAEAGLLTGRRATTHWTAIEELASRYPDIDVHRGVRVVDEDRIVTAAGISAGIDMALHLVGRLHGPDTATWTARRMEYDSEMLNEPV